MNKTYNWTGNRVLDPGRGRQNPPSSTDQQSTAGQTQREYTEMQSGMPTQMQMPAQPCVPMPQPGMPMPQPRIPMQQPGVFIPQDMIGLTQNGPPPSTEPGYIPYYLASNIGKNVRAEFIIGSNQYVDKTGVMAEVGINYFVLRDVNSRANIMCDLYSVKFVTFLD